MTVGAAALLDSSILVAALVEDEPSHEACLALLRGKSACAWSHALSETFATLTGGRLGLRVPAGVAADLIRLSLVPRLRMVELSSTEILGAIGQTEAMGVRGGAIYDYLHLVAARKAGASILCTLNVRHFAALAGHGDPRIQAPADRS